MELEMIRVKILGGGCTSCKMLETLVYEVIERLPLPVNVEKVSDLSIIQSYNVINTPGLVINEKVVCSGRVPGKNEILEWIKTAQ
jgi:small redox-active disulfide protein 2